MRDLLKVWLILVPGLIVSQAQARQHSSKPLAGTYKVAFWYDSDRPTTTLKYQVYDLSKDEYNEPSVDLWLHGILDDDPAHGAYVRDIRTESLPGASEKERLALAIQNEKARWAELHRRPSPPLPKVVDTSVMSSRTSYYYPPRGLVGGPGAPGSPGAPGNPGVYSNLPSSPFPYPYRAGPR